MAAIGLSGLSRAATAMNGGNADCAWSTQSATGGWPPHRSYTEDG